MRLHVPQVPHTTPTKRFSHCAFTQKARLLPGMLRSEGFDVISYGVGDGTEVGGAFVELMGESEHLELLGVPSYDAEPTRLVGDRAVSDSPVYQQFNHYLRDEFKDRLRPGDVICLPFGHAHEAAYQGLDIVASGAVALIETGIGYPSPATMTRVYESNAWRHWILGYEQREGMDWQTQRLEWVVPNYYDLDEWHPIRDNAVVWPYLGRVVYLGRLEKVKGLDIIPLLARELGPEYRLEICGQGDPTPFLTEPNVLYVPPIHGRERAAYLARAQCAIFPSRFIEPFCGASIEARLVGTPVVTSDFGAFTETVADGVDGFRCRSLDGYVEAIRATRDLLRAPVADRARARWSTHAVAKQYGVVFRELEAAMRRGAVPGTRPLVTPTPDAISDAAWVADPSNR